MKLITSTLAFEGKTVNTVERQGKLWLTLPEIASILYQKGVSPSDAPLPHSVRQIQKIYQNHADEFTGSMTTLLKLSTSGGKQMVRVFSLRGAHLIAMFARTPVAKAFRRWVLDVLDGLSSAGRYVDDETLLRVESLCTQAEFLRSWWERFGPAIGQINRVVAGNVHDSFIHAAQSSRSIVRTLGLKSNTEYARCWPWEAGCAGKMEYRAARKVSA